MNDLSDLKKEIMVLSLLCIIATVICQLIWGW